MWGTLDLSSYTDLVVGAFDAVYQDGWFASYTKLEKRKRDLLTHVVFDDAGGIINYKPDQVEDGLGPLLLLLVLERLTRSKAASEDELRSAWDRYADDLRKTIEKGYKKHYRSILRDTFTGTAAEFAREVVKKAAEAATGRASRMEKLLGLSK